MNETIEQVGAVDPDKENSPIVDQETPATEESGLRVMCMFNSREYAPGAAVCSGGRLLRCQRSGYWYDSGRC